MKDSFFKNILVNSRAFFSTNIRKRLNENSCRIAALEAKLDCQTNYENILEYYAEHREEAKKYQKELSFIRETGGYCNFPYEMDSDPLEVTSGLDKDSGLPYVVHQGKRLYFPAKFSVNDAATMYLDYVRVEKILESDDLETAPHQYQSPAIHVAEGDVVFDIGAAEGLFALDQIDRASRVVIVENDSQWIESLRRTFAPYAEKVTFVQKFVSAVDTDSTVSLRKLLLDTEYSSAFVKMDIEGYELPAITSAMELLKERKGIKIAAASYHHQHDADEIKMLFDKLGYRTEFSKGYMLFRLYDKPAPPYFRKGIVRAANMG